MTLRTLTSFAAAATLLMASSPASGQCETRLPVLSMQGNNLGWTVAIDGDWAVAGAPHIAPPFDRGRAFVLRPDGVQWRVHTVLEGDSVAPVWDSFGESLAIDGDRIVVGADKEGGGLEGAVYVYRLGSSGTWDLEAKLLEPEPGELFAFGSDVALEGDTLLVGARGSQSVYIYRLDERKGWVLDDTLRPDDLDDGLGHGFGYAVALAGNVVAIGAVFDDEALLSAGAVYVFELDGKWNQIQKLFAPDPAANIWFGRDVALTPPYLFVGVRLLDLAFVFRDEGGSWKESQQLQGTGGQTSDFGERLDVSGGLAVIGGNEGNGQGEDTGAAWVYALVDDLWIETHRLVASDGLENDAFGTGVAISGGTVMVGASSDDDAGTSSGSVYLYRGFLGDDCNLDGIPDECQILAGTCLDINDNRIPDECEIDCNGNGEQDASEVVDVIDETSGMLSPIGGEEPQSFALDAVPVAVGDVALTVTAFGNFDSGLERISVSLNGVEIGVVFEAPDEAGNCSTPPDAETLFVSAATWNDLTSMGRAAFTLVATSFVNPRYCDGSSWVELGVRYLTPSDADLDGNGLPDDCPCSSDLNGDGVVGLEDLVAVLAAWGPCPGCAEDVDGSGVVGIGDLLVVMSRWGACP